MSRASKRRPAAAAIIALAVAGALLAALGGNPPQGQAQQSGSEKRPNVVVIMTDDQTVEQMTAMPRTRALIGAQGTTFKSNYASYPLCCPSRATYLTGQYAHNHQVEGNFAPDGGYYKLNSRNTLPVWMERAGYATGHVGKYLNNYGTRDPTEVPPGWQEWKTTVGRSTYNYRNYCANEDGSLRSYGDPTASESECPGATPAGPAFQTDLHTLQSLDFIRRHAPDERPFFLSVAYLAPHGGAPADESCRSSAKPADRHSGAFAAASLPRLPSFNEADVSDKPLQVRELPRLGRGMIAAVTRDYRCRRESLLAVDEGVQAIVDELRATGELDDTYILFTSDNGYFQGDHRQRSGKIRVYEPSVAVPALLRGPGVPAGRIVTGLTSNVDLAPTLLDVGSARPGLEQDGMSLRAIARNPDRIRGRALLLENGPSDGERNPRYRAVRTGGYKLVRYTTGERELYDLQADPYELENLARVRAYAPLRAKLGRRLDALKACAGVTCRR